MNLRYGPQSAFPHPAVPELLDHTIVLEFTLIV
jgi:hypothetical protein